MNRLWRHHGEVDSRTYRVVLHRADLGPLTADTLWRHNQERRNGVRQCLLISHKWDPEPERRVAGQNAGDRCRHSPLGRSVRTRRPRTSSTQRFHSSACPSSLHTCREVQEQMRAVILISTPHPQITTSDISSPIFCDHSPAIP